MPDEKRRCRSCCELKDAGEFWGKRAKCKQCVARVPSRTREYWTAWREANRESIRQRARDAYARDPKRKERANAAWRARNKEAFAAAHCKRQKRWVRNNPEKALCADVRSKMARAVSVSSKDIPAELVDAKVAQLRVAMACRSLKKNSDGR